MNEKELKLQERDFKRLIRQEEPSSEDKKRSRLRRQYMKRRFETVMGIKIDAVPPFTFPKDNILKGFGTNRKD